MEGIVKFDEWQKLDLRVAKVVSVEDHPKADKLVVLRIDLGVDLGERTLVAGLKKYYNKEELEGKRCIVFVNLEPATLRGVKSEGMVLAAVDEANDKVVILQPEEDIALGSKIQ
ncbi:hypothetical protein ACFLZZ_02360 [Nanoarchaeota archaeon]